MSPTLAFVLVTLAATAATLAVVARRTRDDVVAALASFAELREALRPAVEVLRVETRETHATLDALRHGHRSRRG